MHCGRVYHKHTGSQMKPGETIELQITDLGQKRRGIGRTAEGRVVFVRDTLPGDRVIARIRKKRRQHLEADLVEITVPSPQRVESGCSYVTLCGGCVLRQLGYEHQLALKEKTVRDAFERLGGFTDLALAPIIPAPSQDYYRNKMEFSFSDQKWVEEWDGEPTGFGLGLHLTGIFSKVLDLDNCLMQSELSVQLVNSVRDEITRAGSTVYNFKTHAGLYRFLAIRDGKQTGEVMVNIVSAEAEHPDVLELARRLQEEYPQLTTIVNNVTRSWSSVATGEEEHILYGPGVIHEKIGKRLYEISANSFFQTNSLQAGNLYDLVLHYAELTGAEVLYDLFSGAGTITIHLADSVREGYGFEVVPDAVRNALRNMQLNGVENLHFIEGDVKHSVTGGEYPRPDVVVLDPPRNGVHRDVLEYLAGLAPQRIVYVSCNPATLARDCRILADHGYQVRKVRPVDMFPHTLHIESVTQLERK